MLVYLCPLSLSAQFVSVCSPCLYVPFISGGQKRDVVTMLGYCWPTVYDADPTLAQYCATVSCLEPC